MVEELRRVVAEENYLRVRVDAVEVLGRLATLPVGVCSPDRNVAGCETSAQNVPLRVTNPHRPEAGALAALLALLKENNPHLRLHIVRALGKSRDPAAGAALLQAARELKEEAFENPTFYRALGYTGDEEAARFMAGRLADLEARKAAWRERRDKEDVFDPPLSFDSAQDKPNPPPQGEGTGEAAPETGATKICPREPAQQDQDLAWQFKQNEYELGLALARLEPKKTARKYLGHPLRLVRQGVQQGIAEAGDVALLKEIEQRRAKSQDSIFTHSAYRAVDEGLKHLEFHADASKLQAMRVWQPQAQAVVRARLEWTVGWVEYRLNCDLCN